MNAVTIIYINYYFYHFNPFVKSLTQGSDFIFLVYMLLLILLRDSYALFSNNELYLYFSTINYI